MKVTILLIMIFVVCKAPEWKTLWVQEEQPVRPYEKLCVAVSWYESKHGEFVYNPLEEAVGWFQIRQCRVDHYNQLTGFNYKLEDFYDYTLSKEMFLFFADRFGPYDLKRIACAWNGSGPMTEDYWKEVQKYLN